MSRVLWRGEAFYLGPTLELSQADNGDYTFTISDDAHDELNNGEYTFRADQALQIVQAILRSADA